MIHLQIIETGKRFGNMNAEKDFFTKEYELTKEECEHLFLENRKKAAAFYGFDENKFYMPTQQRNGSHQEVTKEMIAQEKDGWNLEIPADILIVTDKTPNVVVGYPVADCAVVIMSDLKNGVSATAHCSASFVDSKLPQMTLEALKEDYDSKEENIFVYVSACASDNWVYDSYPKFIQDHDFWERTSAIQQEGNKYRIDLRKAIQAQLKTHHFYQILYNPADTITNPSYYSNFAAYHGDTTKKGRHYAGVFYKKR
mgnify:FL=1